MEHVLQYKVGKAAVPAAHPRALPGQPGQQLRVRDQGQVRLTEHGHVDDAVPGGDHPLRAEPLHRPAESGPLVDPRWKEIDLPAGDHRLEGGAAAPIPGHAFRRRDVRISGVDVHTLHAPHGGGPALPGQMIQDRGQRLPVVPDQRLGRGVPRPVHLTVPQQDGAVGGQGNPGRRAVRPLDALVLLDGPGGDGQQMDPLDDLGQQVWRLPGEEALLGPVQTLHTPVLGLPVPVGEEERVVQVAGKQNRSHGYVSARSRIRPQAR